MRTYFETSEKESELLDKSRAQLVHLIPCLFYLRDFAIEWHITLQCLAYRRLLSCGDTNITQTLREAHYLHYQLLPPVKPQLSRTARQEISAKLEAFELTLLVTTQVSFKSLAKSLIHFNRKNTPWCNGICYQSFIRNLFCFFTTSLCSVNRLQMQVYSAQAEVIPFFPPAFIFSPGKIKSHSPEISRFTDVDC